MKINKFNLIKNKNKIIFISITFLSISIIGIITSCFYPTIGKPINLGMDFLGGSEIRVDRICQSKCVELTSDEAIIKIKDISSQKKIINNARLQVQNDNKTISIRTPFLSVDESSILLSDINTSLGPINFDSKISRSIGPKLGKKLLFNGLASLAVALFFISLYISIRFDKKYAFYSLIALFHDLIIVFGIFSWLGILLSVEVNSLFAVSLLTIAGYSVNDTVVIFDRIRENIKTNPDLNINNSIENSVNESLRRTLFTSITTLLPLITLIVFGSYSLYWFSISLSLGILIGSYSSILLAPSLLLNKK